MDRNPAWATFVEQNKETNLYDGVFYNPPEDQCYKFQNSRPKEKPRSLKIYETHVGMSS